MSIRTKGWVWGGGGHCGAPINWRGKKNRLTRTIWRAVNRVINPFVSTRRNKEMGDCLNIVKRKVLNRRNVLEKKGRNCL